MKHKRFYLMDSLRFHADFIDMTDKIADVYGSFGFGDAREHLKVLIGDANYAAWTIVDDEGNIIGITGAFMIIAGVARVWYCPSRMVFEDSRVRAKFFRTLQVSLDSIIKQWGLRRVECIIREDFSEAFVVPFNHRFGFQIEGLMKHFDTRGANYYLLAKYCIDDTEEVVDEA